MIFNLILSRAAVLAEPTVLVLDEISIEYFKTAREGFESGCEYYIKRLDISKMNRAAAMKNIKEKRPGLIYVMGIQTLEEILGITDTPVVYSLVPNPGEFIGDRPNFTGVGIRIPMEIKFEILKIAMPEAERVGMITSGNKSEMEQVRRAGQKFGFKITIRKLYEIDNFPNLLKGLGNHMEVFVMALDDIVYNERTVGQLFEYAREHMLPVVTTNEIFLDKGGFISIHPKPFHMGLQAAEMANRILKGADVAIVSPEGPINVFVKINRKTVRRLGLAISDELVTLEKMGYKGKSDLVNSPR